LEELDFDKSSLGINLLETSSELILIAYHQEEERLRIKSIETFGKDEKRKEKLLDSYHLYDSLHTTLIPLVRYVYSKDDDLVAVHGKEDLLLRTFTYQNHIMTSHGVPEGLVSYYEYTTYSPKGKVIKNTTNTNEVWTFEYQKDQTTVTDTLDVNRGVKLGSFS